MKTFSPVSWMRKAIAGAALALLAVSPAWAGKYASIVIDLDSHKVLHARDADETRYPASLTKVMTLYLVFDAIDAGKLKLSERMTVSRAASRQQPSKLGLKSGSTIKVEDAIRALVTKSANDVAVVLAEKLGSGSESKFVAKMNAKAKELGLESTHFMNASGLPNKKQTTTARDMAKLAEAMFLDHKTRYNYFALPSFTWNKRKYANHNELLKKVDGVDGIKTGYTNASGYNLMASAEREGHRVIAVMLGGTSGRSRDQHVADLLEAAFLEIKGAPMTAELTDPRNRIAFGERGNTTADALAMAQLRRFSGDQATLVSSTDPTLVAEAEDESTGSTEEGDEDGEAVAEDDAGDGADKADPAAAPAPPAVISVAATSDPAPTITTTAEPQAALIAAAPAPAPAPATPIVATAAPVTETPTPIAAAPAPAPAAPVTESVAVTSEYTPGAAGPGIADPAAALLQLH